MSAASFILSYFFEYPIYFLQLSDESGKPGWQVTFLASPANSRCSSRSANAVSGTTCAPDKVYCHADVHIVLKQNKQIKHPECSKDPEPHMGGADPQHLFQLPFISRSFAMTGIKCNDILSGCFICTSHIKMVSSLAFEAYHPFRRKYSSLTAELSPHRIMSPDAAATL